MQKIIIVDKPVGFTPLEAVKKIKEKKPELAEKKITYAGRLDPLAHGVLLLLIGEETKKRDSYLSLSKTYEFEIVFGLESDTYDLLGYSKTVNVKKPINVNLIVNTFVNKHIGKQLQSYPPYSSKPVNGKPLFWWARNNKLHEIEMPKKEIEIYDFICLSLGVITVVELKQKINDSLKSVNGDFRQKEILTRWDTVLKELKNKTQQTAKFSITCSSGTYMRELIHQLGKELGCGAVAIDIFRTGVGDYTIKDAIKI
jgi:tRNA pseudouridine55 synthase